MGCQSSKALQYPGQRLQAQAPYRPNASEFNTSGQTTSHFVSYGGGNALVLQQGGAVHQQVGATLHQTATATPLPQKYVQITLPQGVVAGQRIQVQAPDGRLNEIIVPAGMRPGSTFTVEFADVSNKQTSNNYSGYNPPGSAPPTATAMPANNLSPTTNGRDDGFASGFHNPTFESSTAVNYNSYPHADDAKPVYSAP
jgi:hypothetical protein